MALAKQARKCQPPRRRSRPLIRELVEIADYIAHLRNEIAALRANELTRDRLPMAHEELGSVVAATAGATNSIMNTAEEILGLPNDKNYRADRRGAHERHLRGLHLPGHHRPAHRQGRGGPAPAREPALRASPAP